MIINHLAFDEGVAEDRAGTISALGHPTRLRIASFLALHREATLSRICMILGLSEGDAREHLEVLVEHGIASVKKTEKGPVHAFARPELLPLLNVIANSRSARRHPVDSILLT